MNQPVMDRWTTVTRIHQSALDAAELMETGDDDLLAGPRSIRELATTTTDPDRQAAIVTGLAAMGDRRVLALLDERLGYAGLQVSWLGTSAWATMYPL